MKPIQIVIDGDCQFCRFSSKLLVKIINRPLDIQVQGSERTQQWEKGFPHLLWKEDSIKVLEEGEVYIKSTAISYLMRYAKWYVQPIRVLFLLPTNWLDKAYDLVARNRYLWGKACSID